MGALTVASVSTMTSCKDYDDDINNLQGQIDALSKTLSELQTKINDGSILKSVESDGNGGIKVTVTKNDTKTEYKALEPRVTRATLVLRVLRVQLVLLVLLAKTASTTFLILRLAHSGYMVTVTRLHTTLRLSIQQLTRMSSLQFGTTIT